MQMLIPPSPLKFELPEDDLPARGMQVLWRKFTVTSCFRSPAHNDLDIHGKSMKLGNGLSQGLPGTVRGKVKILPGDAVAGGGHCQIYLGQLREGRKKEFVALKLLSVHVPEHEKQMFRREVQSWCQFHHDNIIKFYGTCTLKSHLFMVSPWMKNGNLLEFLPKNPTADRKKILLQVANALVYLHDDVGMVHGDVKAQNILISDAGNALLADFGLSTRIEKLVGEQDTPAHIRTLGSSRFTAPELIAGAEQESEVAATSDTLQTAQFPSKNVKTDVYAFGMLILQTFTERPPWLHVTRTLQVFRLVLEGAKPPRPQGDAVLRGLDDLHWSIAERCWDLQPSSRPLMREIVRDLTQAGAPIGTVHAEPPHSPPLLDLTNQIMIVDAGLPISMGGMSDIFRAQWERSPAEATVTVALKVSRTFRAGDASTNLPKRLRRELTMWSKLHHPNVLPLCGTCIFRSRLCAVSPWMKHGDCLQYLKNCPNANRLRLGQEAAQGVAYLHSFTLIHGNIKANNVLISDDGHAQLGGLGTVKALDSLEPDELTGDSQIVGSVRWMAPELFDSEPAAGRITLAADVYSFAMLMLEIFTEQPPFSDMSSSQVILSVIHGRRPDRPREGSGPGGLDDSLWNLLQFCWATKSSHRPPMNDVAVALAQIEQGVSFSGEGGWPGQWHDRSERDADES